MHSWSCVCLDNAPCTYSIRIDVEKKTKWTSLPCPWWCFNCTCGDNDKHLPTVALQMHSLLQLVVYTKSEESRCTKREVHSLHTPDNCCVKASICLSDHRTASETPSSHTCPMSKLVSKCFCIFLKPTIQQAHPQQDFSTHLWSCPAVNRCAQTTCTK